MKHKIILKFFVEMTAFNKKKSFSFGHPFSINYLAMIGLNGPRIKNNPPLNTLPLPLLVSDLIQPEGARWRSG